MGLGRLTVPCGFSTDDMEIAPDFFDYFEAMAQLLDQDRCVEVLLYVFRKQGNVVFV